MRGLIDDFGILVEKSYLQIETDNTSEEIEEHLKVKIWCRSLFMLG